MIRYRDMLTVGELRDFLKDMPSDNIVLLFGKSNDEKRPMARAYQYGYVVDNGDYWDAQYSGMRAITIL